MRINLPGPDVTHEELGAWLDRIDASESLVILDCPQAGFAIKRLTSPTRIVICAARSDQPYATRFSDFFVPALTEPASDGNQDGMVSLLEAFQYACQGD